MTTTISGTSGVSQPQVSVAAAINTPTAGLVTFTLNPCVLAFRNSTLSNGAVGTKTISSAITLATDNTGASFGATTAVQVRLYLLAIDDGTATPRLGVTLGSGLRLDETNVLASTTAITGAVTDGTKVYTTSGLGAGAYPYKVVGVVDATWTTGSGWVTTPALVQGLTTEKVNSSDAFSAYLPTPSQSITSSTLTKVALSAEEFDLNSKFDSVTNYRWTPSQGYYQINWAAYCQSPSMTAAYSIVRKNGANLKEGSTYVGAGLTEFSSTGSALVYMNGADYLELFAFIAGTSPVVVYSSTLTYFSGVFARRG